MEHAKTIKEFIPSVEEALLFKREWIATKTDYASYKELSSAFVNKTLTKEILSKQCNLIYRTYNQRAAIKKRLLSAEYLMSIDNLEGRLLGGDLSLPDEIVRGNSGNQFVFAVMFCHHSNPSAFYGCTGNSIHTIIELNKHDRFWNMELHEMELKKYALFHSVMDSFVNYYHLEKLSHIELDIMLRGISRIIEKKEK